MVYKFKRIFEKPNVSYQFKKITEHYMKYEKAGYNIDSMRQSACLVVNSITANGYGFLFNCTTVSQASDSITVLT